MFVDSKERSNRNPERDGTQDEENVMPAVQKEQVLEREPGPRQVSKFEGESGQDSI
jgi:hypothetical protein